MPNPITNDQGLRAALNSLSAAQQRELAGRFVASVGHLSDDPRISRAVEATVKTDISDQEREEIYKTVKLFATQSYTACGHDADWAAQAEHFVAAAAAASLAPASPSGDKGKNAWNAAMQARMAKNCEMIFKDEGTIDNEAEKQYALTEKYLAR